MESPIKSPSPENLKREVSTPYLLRRLKQTKYAHTMPSQRFDTSGSSSSSSSSGSSSSGSSDDEEEAEVSQRRRVIDHEAEEGDKENIESYFHCRKTGNTSNKTLHDLQLEELDHAATVKLLGKVKIGYTREKSALYADHCRNFPLWSVYLQDGFNLCLYGVGSKRQLLRNFAKKQLKHRRHMIVNGYFPNLTVRDILYSVTRDILDSEASFRTVQDQIAFIGESVRDDPVYLLINNIAGANLRTEKAQQALAELAAVEQIRMVATVDHINAPLLWDEYKTQLFNWLWVDCTTFDSYEDETSTECSLMIKQTGALALSSMAHVLRSLTPNAQGIFRLLANFQLQSGKDFQGITFQDFYLKCREKFLVNSDATLRTQLTEFRDHQLIKSRNSDGTELLYIPVEQKILQQFLEVET